MAIDKETNKNSFDLHLLKRVLKLTTPYKRLFYYTIFLAVALAPITAVRPYIIKEMVDVNIFQNDISGLKMMALLYVGITLLNTWMRYSLIYKTSVLGQSVIKDLRVRVFKHISKLKLRFFDQTPIGTVTTRTINDVEAIKRIFEQGSITIVADILSIFMVLAMMFYASWKLTIIFLLTVPLLVIATYIFKEKVKTAYQKVRTQISAMNAFLQERITGMRVIQIFNAQDQEMKKFKSINRKYTKANLDSIFYYAVFFPVVELINSLALALLVFWGTKGIWNASISPGAVIAFPLFLNMIFRPIRNLANRFNELQMGLVAAERVYNLLDDESHIADEGAIDNTKIEGEVEFKNVNFAYDDENFVLKDVSFKIEPSTTLAIVGSTGSGKTTIINLLGRYYNINGGEILIDGKNIDQYTLPFLRERLALVLQDVFLFDGTVFENIKLRDQSISDEVVIEAAKQIGAHEYIMNMPDQYNFHIMERGNNLSMGQRQLISFVRALVVNPNILILDEATSSVDTETEATIQYAIEKLIDKRSSIIIAHRLSTIRHADKILVMDQGKVAEIGTHNELMEIKDGMYKALYNLQFDGEPVA